MKVQQVVVVRNWILLFLILIYSDLLYVVWVIDLGGQNLLVEIFSLS